MVQGRSPKAEFTAAGRDPSVVACIENIHAVLHECGKTEANDVNRVALFVPEGAKARTSTSTRSSTNIEFEKNVVLAACRSTIGAPEPQAKSSKVERGV